MVDTEVESILREIRERVRSEQRAGQVATSSSVGRSAMGNGARDAALARGGEPETAASEALSLIDSYLATTARSWDRLPPVVSNRSGLAAGLELWLKRRLRAGTRWFTWEQVNFNAAVHHALRDTLKVLKAHEQALANLRAEMEARQAVIDRMQTEIRAEIESQRLVLEGQRLALEAQRPANAAHQASVDARLSELVAELRERDGYLRDEQRVCFKQLSLEAGEAAVLEDRARRKAEALLAELTRRMEQLEK